MALRRQWVREHRSGAHPTRGMLRYQRQLARRLRDRVFCKGRPRLASRPTRTFIASSR